jgi:hypothetical protein
MNASPDRKRVRLTKAILVDKDLWEQAKQLALWEHRSVSEAFSDFVRPFLTREYKRQKELH